MSLKFNEWNVKKKILAAYLSIGSISIIPYIDILFALLLFPFSKFKNKKELLLIVYTILFLIFSSLFYEQGLFKIIARFAKIFSIIIAFINIAKLKSDEAKYIINVVFNTYKFIGYIIIIDAFCYITIGQSLWPPISYLGLRFSGPFFDPNFMALFYGILFLYTFNNNYYSKKAVFVYGVIIILALSWASIGFIIISYFGYSFFTRKICINHFLVIGLYLASFFIIITNIEFIENSFLNIFSSLFPTIPPEALEAKFLSLYYRFESQGDAFNTPNFFQLLFGMGPHTILEYLPLDTHNSYIGYAFELGYVNLIFFMSLVFIIPFRNKSKFMYRSALYCFLCALTLNVHYSVAYPLIALMMTNSNNYNIKLC